MRMRQAAEGIASSVLANVDPSVVEAIRQRAVVHHHRSGDMVVSETEPHWTGIVLAGTFSVLAVLPLVFLTEIGFVIAFGVLLDTFLVRSVLVPALVFDMGDPICKPSRLAERAGADRSVGPDGRAAAESA